MTKIVFMGTPQYAVNILAGLLTDTAAYEILAVVTQPDRRVGRRQRLQENPVKSFATAHHLPVMQPERLAQSVELQQIIELQTDLIITAAYGQFLPPELLAAPRLAAVNVHGSLLPKNRGGAPIQRAIMNGDTQTGITLMYMAAQMDAGDIISQQAVPIEATDTAGSLFEKLSLVGRDLLLTTLPQIIAGTNERIPQDDSQATFTPNIKPTEELININQPATQINRQVRGLNPDPVAYLWLDGLRTKIYQATVVDQATTLAPGHVVARTKKHLWIAAGEQTVLSLDEIQPAGKSRMSIAAFLNGKGKDIQIGDQIIK